MPRQPEEQLPPWVGTRDPLDQGVFVPPHQPGDAPRGPFEPIPVPHALPAEPPAGRPEPGPEPPAPSPAPQAAPSIPPPEPRRPSAAPSVQAAVLASQPRRSAAASVPAAAQAKRAEEEEFHAVPWADSPRASAEPPVGPHLPPPQNPPPETLGGRVPKSLSGAGMNFGGTPGGGTAGDSRELIDAIEDLTDEVKRLRESIERDRPGRGNATAPGRKTTEVEYPPVRGGGAAPSLPKRGGA